MQASDSTCSANWQKTFFRLRTPPCGLNNCVKSVVNINSDARSFRFVLHRGLVETVESINLVDRTLFGANVGFDKAYDREIVFETL